ncbi:thioredoxin domain-containing protein [bacterium]|nr:thioredoxin domain-containing protein [bacterium]
MNKKSLILTSLFGIALSACTGGSSPARTADQLVRPLADDVVILEYTGGKITAKDINARVDAQVKQFSEELIDAYKKNAEQMLVMQLMEAEAKKQGVANPQELMARVAQDVTVTDEQVAKFIVDNNLKDGIQDPRTGEKRKVSDEEVKGFLMEQEMQNKQQAFFGELRQKANVTMKLEKPRAKVISSGKEPFKGGASAKVVIHEFSDFQCPFCSRGNEVVKQIVTEYGDKIKLVFRHMPLSFHPEAEPSAIASMCAFKEGKFWEMHDKMFEFQKDLSTESYKKWAGEIGLNQEAFDKCFDNKETQAAVKADMDAAEAMGVNSTPTFFVNGKKIAGALPFGQFKAMIDEELANAK